MFFILVDTSMNLQVIIGVTFGVLTLVGIVVGIIIMLLLLLSRMRGKTNIYYN